MAQGTIKKLVSDKGFGFISGERGDVFFHHSGVIDGSFDNLREGQSVEYDVEASGKGGKGPRAINVKAV
jgi:CspA family cold shock protein